MEKTGFFESAPNRKSSTRLQMFLTLMFGFVVIGYQVYANADHTPDFLTMLTVFLAAFAPKSLRDLSELANNKTIKG